MIYSLTLLPDLEQSLGGAIHNVDRNCAPVFIYAGQSPVTQYGEHLGSRNEFIHWLQDVPDQLSIVRQYMRYTAMIQSPLHVSDTVLRALTFAKSEPKGPVYLSAIRETMEEPYDDVKILKQLHSINLKKWSIIKPRAVDQASLDFIAETLLASQNPLVITGSLGRNANAVDSLVELTNLLSLSVLSSAPSSVCFPANHTCHVGFLYGPSPNPDMIPTTDCILILDSDVPYIPKFDLPDEQKCITIHIDRDPLKVRQSYFHFPVDCLVHADTDVALKQIITAIKPKLTPSIEQEIKSRTKRNQRRFERQFQSLVTDAALRSDKGLTVPLIVRAFRSIFPGETLYLNEAITNYATVWNHLKADYSGTVLTSGGSSLGWGTGAAIGAQIALEEQGKDIERPIVLFTGDGSFLFGIPSVSYWMARKYEKPFVTVIFNNSGWNAPKKSLLGVYNAKEQVEASLESLHLSFGGVDGSFSPDYGAIAKASGGALSFKPTNYDSLLIAIEEACKLVTKERKSVVLDCIVPRS